MSKIRSFLESIRDGKFSGYLKFVRKGNFFILIDEEAFFFSERYSFKLTRFGKNSVKTGFPVSSKSKWSGRLEAEGLSFVFFDISGNVLSRHDGKTSFGVDVSEYLLARDRILAFDKIDIEEKETKDFLLKRKAEAIYKKLSISIMRFPKKERFYLREKLERSLLDILEDIHIFGYEPQMRSQKAKSIFLKILVFRDFFRLAYDISNHMKDTVYLDLSDDIIEILKITKALMKRYDGIVKDDGV